MPRPSDKTLLQYDIVGNPTTGVLNQLYICHGHPEDGPISLVLRDPDTTNDNNTVVQIEHVTLDANPATGSTHFVGNLVDGGTITGHVRPGPEATELVGKATLTF